MHDVIWHLDGLKSPWMAGDPFLFCAHHRDAYPAGNARLGPSVTLSGRNLGQDFSGQDGWSMYHGGVVPGFPQHPHRGFETVTIVRRGLIDHSDSLGATARFGAGDVQWLTAGSGVVHAEMFPLVDDKTENPLELFQIWLNLPAADKLVKPYFTMLWNEQIPVISTDGARVRVVAGALGDKLAPAPPPSSWAARPDANVAIWLISLEPQARWTLPAAPVGTSRNLYFFSGQSLKLAGQDVPASSALVLRPDVDIVLENGPTASELLFLQGRPIGEPIVAHGPFVMTSREEIVTAFADYRRTGFGGWPWPSDDPVHAREAPRFAKHPDGRVDKPR